MSYLAGMGAAPISSRFVGRLIQGRLRCVSIRGSGGIPARDVMFARLSRPSIALSAGFPGHVVTGSFDRIATTALGVWLQIGLLIVACVTASLPAAQASELKPQAATAPAPIESHIAQLVAQLGDKDYSARQHAQDELAKLGFVAYDALTAAASHEDFEVASRARYLLRLLRSQWATEKDPPEAHKILEGYELIGPRERLGRIIRLIQLPQSGGIPVVCRLIRFEKSELLSNQAAFEIIHHEPSHEAGWLRTAKALRENLAGSRRSAAQRLLVYVRLREHPEATIEEWSKLVDAQQRAMSTSPDASVPGSTALMTYLLAEAYARSGNQAKAEQTADKARQFGGGGEPAQIVARLQLASSLRQRGWIRWSEGECRRAAEIAPPIYKVLAFVQLSEMLHDQGNPLAAAEARQKAVVVIERLPRDEKERVKEQLGQNFDMDVGEITARTSYFLACHWLEKGNAVKHRQYLEEAIRADAMEVDTLIAMCKLPDQSAAQREKTQKLVQQSILLLRRDIDESPNEPKGFNQIAWLMGNTGNNLDEALRFANKAVELAPETGAYLDTLAHVYFARGDYEKAVLYQSKAAQLDPHSGLIVKELKAFRAVDQRHREAKAVSKSQS